MKIGLVPMSAKPYHRGHHYLVTTAAAQNDKVLLFISISDRCRKGEVPIYGEDMHQIWCNQLEGILPNNVEPIYGGSPVRKVYETLISEEEKLNLGSLVENTYTVYSDEEDTRLNYTVGRSKKPGAISPVDKYFPSLYTQGYVSFAAETNPGMFSRGDGAPAVSGTKMRNMLPDANKKSQFVADLPEDLPDESKSSIYDRLRKRIQKEHSQVEDDRDRAILESFFRTRKKRPEKGTEEYSTYLEEVMDELHHIKSSYDARKKTGARYRKEASKIQDAYSELRRLKRKNQKLLNAQLVNEYYNQGSYNYKVEITDSNDLDRESIRNFFRRFKS